MYSGHMLREGTWPDHVRVNLGLANVHATQIVPARAGGKELSKQLTDTCYGFPCSPLR
jgi:hypothetical protein